jgi:chaperonin GroEL (HSP60 family)
MMARKISKPYIHGKNLELLKQLIQDGYVYTGKNGNRLRFLQKIFPSIKRAQYKNRSIYFLEDKNKLALREMMEHDPSRILNYHELSRACQVFNTDISKPEKKQFFGKNKPRSRKINPKSKRKNSSVSKEKKSISDDFFGRFLHSEVLSGSSSESALK